jgi:drug/metabolite transporter (DMT)-like permease
LHVTPITAAIVSAIGFGIADFMGGRAARRLGSPLAVALVQGVALLFILTVVLLGSYPIPSGRDLRLSLIAGLADGIALILLYRGLAIGRISVVAPLTGVCSIGLPALAEMLLVTTVGGMIVAGIALAAVAVLLIAQGGGEADEPRSLRRSVALGLGSGLTFGITNLSLGLLEPVNANGGMLVMRCGAVATAIAMLLVQSGTIRLDRRGLTIGGAAGILDAVGMMGLVYSATTGLIGVAVSINSLYAGVTVLLGVVLLGERLGRVRLLGLVVGAVAVLLLANGHQD